MFTECPECSTAFRVTAKVLQQAAGRVRCGGCGHAFSALEHLTEELPDPLKRDDDATDFSDDSDLTSEEKFRETSKQLLQTLSELSGADEVRIEDTGIEWQVLDDEEDDGSAADAVPTVASLADPAEAADALESLSLGDDDDSYETLELVDDDDTPAQSFADEEITAAAEDRDEPVDDADSDDAADDDLPLEVEEELAAIHSELSAKEEEDDEAPVDLDSQFEMQAEAMGIDISGSQKVIDEDGDDLGSDPALEHFEREFAAEAQADESNEEITLTDDEATMQASLDDGDPVEDAANDVQADAVAPVEAEADEQDVVAEAVSAAADEDDEVDVTEVAAEVAEPVEESTDEDEDDAAAAFTPDLEILEHSQQTSDDESPQKREYSGSHAMPELSEEEMTINQEIDQELLAVAAQGQDLRATIVGLESLEPSEKLFDEQAEGVETIVMEGEAIRGAFEKEREREKREAALKRFDKAGNLIDSYMTRRAVRGGDRSTDPPSYAAIAGAVLMLLALVGQVVHANRDTLSTFDIFNQTVAPVYRMLGNPITPEWSITGWQFEATNGSITEGDDVLTIFSRIGNRSQQALPYPLVHVSLTDRWEEIIGSAILEPGEYLAGDQNPNQPVTPGDNFTAVITIDEPSVDATGFKLNVCYRVSPGRVRCATEDFKD